MAADGEAHNGENVDSTGDVENANNPEILDILDIPLEELSSATCVSETTPHPLHLEPPPGPHPGSDQYADRDPDVDSSAPAPAPAPIPERPLLQVLQPPRYTRRLPSEEATALAKNPTNESRRRSNATRSTRHILLRFSGAIPQIITPAEKERRAEWERKRKAALESLERLREPTKRSRLEHLWRVKTRSEKLRMHHTRADFDARGACGFWFPQLAGMEVHVCDFRAEGGSRERTTLGKIEDWLESKPDNVQVRWIHVSLGKGLLQSTIEDIFRYTGSGEIGKPFVKGSLDPTWNYPELPLLTLLNHSRYIQKMDAFRLLSDSPLAAHGAGDDTLQGFTRRQIDDLLWRSNHVGRPVDFWDMTRANLPNPLPERFLGQACLTNLKGPLPGEDDRQAIADHPHFLNSMLATAQVRFFHRSDGYLLTFSNQTGVDYLGKPFPEWLNQPDQFMADGEVSALANVAENLTDSGTSKWHYPTVEWLIVYILTEVAAVPHNIRQGRNSTNLLTAYQDMARDLKQRQKRPWERGESPKLVRRYLNCLEELRAIADLASQKLAILQGLLLDASHFESEYRTADPPIKPNTTGDEVETMKERIDWAIEMAQEQHKDATFLVDYFRTALGELFQLRSIEQNEMAIVADSQNKAVLLFTGVTVIFLPLSFFTSYFGMNLRGIVDTRKDEEYFWSVCGSIAFVLVLILVGYAFRADVQRKVLQRIGIGKAKRPETFM